jgi:tetratricopeptide (TPR) repeat protein
MKRLEVLAPGVVVICLATIGAFVFDKYQSASVSAYAGDVAHVPAIASEESQRAARNLFNLGVKFEANHQAEDALGAFSAAVDQDPLFSPAYVNRGYLYLEQGKMDLAMEDMNRAISANPKDELAYYGRGQVHIAMGEYVLALQNYDQAISIRPKMAGFYQARGHAFEKLDRLDAAALDFSRVVKMEPRNVDGWWSLGLIRAKQLKIDEASRAVKRCLNLDPSHENCLFLRNAIQELRKAPAETEGKHQPALTMGPFEPCEEKVA